MRFVELLHVPKLTWLSGALAAALAAGVALRPAVVVAPPQVDVQPPIDLPLGVRDNVGDPSCASDVTTEGTRIYVHLREDPKTCAGVTRVYRMEGERMIFEQELID